MTFLRPERVSAIQGSWRAERYDADGWSTGFCRPTASPPRSETRGCSATSATPSSGTRDLVNGAVSLFRNASAQAPRGRRRLIVVIHKQDLHVAGDVLEHLQARRRHPGPRVTRQRRHTRHRALPAARVERDDEDQGRIAV
jgi:hypothetical protein